MFIPTHLLIAKHIKKAIEKKLNVKIHHQSFSRGNIVPDIYPKLILLPHYKKDSFGKIINMINLLRNDSLSIFYKNNKAFCVKLGIINHYLADFFCFPHNDYNTNKFVPHNIYEINLASQFYTVDLNDICNNSISLIAETNTLNIEQFIEEKHYEYMHTAPSINKDIIYSVNVCSAVSYLIIKQCLNNNFANIA